MKHALKFTALVALTSALQFSPTCNAQVPQVEWGSVFYGLTPPVIGDCAVDQAGNTYTMGYLYGIADMDPSSSVYPLNSIDGNIFVAKLSASGSLIWAKQFGGMTALVADMSVDNSGNIYLTGSFSVSSVDFDPGPGVYQLTASSGGFTGDGYLLKLTTSGTFSWARNIGGPLLLTRAMSIDSLGQPIITGNYQGTIDFDPGPGLLQLSSAGNAADVFVVKYDPAGDLLWASAFGGTAPDDGLALASDGNGNTYVGGSFGGIVDFDPGSSSYNLSASGAGDGYVSKLNAQGGLIWAVAMGGTDLNIYDQTYALSVADGEVTAAGSFRGSGDFDPSAGTAVLTSQGGTDGFVMRMTDAGNFLWAIQIGGWEGDDQCNRLVASPNGDVTVSGSFQGTVDFDPGPGTELLSWGQGSKFVCRLDAGTQFQWAFQGATEAACELGANELFCIGSCSAGSDIDPSPNVVQMTQSGALVMKLEPQISTGLAAAAATDDFVAYRDAISDDIWHMAFPPLAGASTFSVYDAGGRLLQQGAVGDGATRFTLDVSGEPRGLLIVRISNASEEYQGKILCKLPLFSGRS